MKLKRLLIIFIFYFLINRFRCPKYWLKGWMEGMTEIFVDKPDDINLAHDGSF